MTLLQIHQAVQEMKDRARKEGREDLADCLSCAALYLKSAHYQSIGEGTLPTGKPPFKEPSVPSRGKPI